MAEARITSFLVKIASRCNLDCDYCYVYHHADQTWRNMPRLLSSEHREAFARRLAEHVRATGLTRVAVVLHGGEPLLAGAEAISAFAQQIRSAVTPGVEVDIGLQTNGLLLDETTLDLFENQRISVSLSMDGPRDAQDLHRRSRKGRSSFDRVEKALQRLNQRPTVFAGVIAVIDAAIRPERLLSYFAGQNVPKLDFLLPDSHHGRPPPGRAASPSLYEDWLIEAFDVWLDRYPQIPVRTFEALLDAVAGLPSRTDAFGFGDVSMLTVESDGTWHDLDVFKVASAGATQLFGSVADTSVADILASHVLEPHRRLLSRDGLPSECQRCEFVDVCGGGSVPHRFGNGTFENPTVYCREMKRLIAHVRRRLAESLAAPDLEVSTAEIDVEAFELAETSGDVVATLYRATLQDDEAGFVQAVALAADGSSFRLSLERNRALARRAGCIAWQRALRAAHEGRLVRDVNGQPLVVDPSYVHRAVELASSGRALEIGANDPWLRLPFGSEIHFEDEALAVEGRRLVAEALDIIQAWRPAVAAELRLICSAIQFVRDPSAHPDKIVSFSDDSVPGALFVSILQGSEFVDPYDLADSLIHEYRHQKLYLLERLHPTTHPGALVVSPWREDLRPASGLLHAIFVFVELRRFWEHVRDKGPSRLWTRAAAQVDDTQRNLTEAFTTLKECRLTAAGEALAAVLEARSRRLEPVD